MKRPQPATAPRKRASNSAWRKHARHVTSTVDAVRLREVTANYRRLPDETRMRLAREIADTRGPELCAAYRNIVMLAAGYKLKRSHGSATYSKVEKIACVVFVVSRKWKKDGRAAKTARPLPAHLLAYATLGDKRVVCAVPTDVVPAEGARTAHAQAASGVYGRVGMDAGSFGNVACAVDLQRGASAERFALSCQHVFSPAPELGLSTLRYGVTIYDAGDIRSLPEAEAIRQIQVPVPAHLGAIGRSSRYGGAMRADNSPSFDVQLAAIPTAARLQRALAGLRLSKQQPCFKTVEAFDAAARNHVVTILVSANNPFWLDTNAGATSRAPVTGRFLRHVGSAHPITYDVREGEIFTKREIYHSRLIDLRLLVGDTTFGGDSGSPVVMELDGQHTLVGMHIAGGPGIPDDGYSHSYVIPAWALFERDNYRGLPLNSELELVTEV